MTERNTINLFTHTDLDGAGCAVLANLYAAASGSTITTAHCDYSNIDAKVNELLDNIELAESMKALPDVSRIILITDISVTPQTAERLDNLRRERENITIAMVDHHQVKDELLAYDWALVNTSCEHCGTSLLYTALPYVTRREIPQFGYASVRQFIEDVRLYDTWQFDKNSETNSENLNILLHLLGAEEFVYFAAQCIDASPSATFCVKDTGYYPFVEHERESRKEYCALRNQTMKRVLYEGYTVGVVFAENNISMVGDYVLQKNPDLDFCAIVNLPNAVSLRTRKPDINVGIDIARPLGGGGHPMAAGYQLKDVPSELIKQLIGFDADAV